MSKASALVVAVVVASLTASGCSDPKAREIERQRVELETTRAELARARAEAEVARAELIQALTDAQVARTELARLRGEPPPPPVAPRKTESEFVPLEQRFASLKANYDRGAIHSGEWSQLKAKVLDSIPKDLPFNEKRTLGQRLIDLKGAYESSAIMSSEWSTAKAKLIAQVPAPRMPAPVLDRELGDLKKAYDAGAILSSEWTQAKAEVSKWAK